MKRFRPQLTDVRAHTDHTYALATAPTLALGVVSQASTGLVRFAQGHRSPPQGLRASAAHEIAYVVKGRVQVDTADETLMLEAGDVVTTSPAVPHATTALEDAELFFVLLDPR